MANKKPTLAGRAWKLLRLALICPRKGRSFRHRVMKLLSARFHHSDHLGYYREHELSFDDTPTFRFRLHRPHFPCNSPTYSFREDNDIEDINGEEERLEFEAEKEGEEKGIDDEAEEFIERFYNEMKLQRQASVLSYNEMLRRGNS